MKIFFIHNTKNQQNIGCKMTSGGLEILYKGHSIDNFTAESVLKIRQVLNSSRSLKPITKSLKSGSRLHFELVKKYILLKKGNILKSINFSDAIVINGEGSIHHNRLTGVIILAIASIAKDVGKFVCIVNSTFQELGRPELETLKSVDRIVVRELYSQKYLLEKGIKSILGADAAWVYLYKKWPELMLSHKKTKGVSRVLITGGVDLKKDWLNFGIQSVISNVQSFDYLYIDSADKDNMSFIKDSVILGAKVSGNTILENPHLLLNYDLVISGRHHINILSMYLGVPVLPLSSNTFKIESTIATLKKDLPKLVVTLNKKEVSQAIKGANFNLSL